jgi:hypothetical protein
MWCHWVIVWFSGKFVCILSVVILKKQIEDYRYKSSLLPRRFPSTSNLCSAQELETKLQIHIKQAVLCICCLDLYTSRQCTYNVALKCINATIVAVEKQYYIFWVCVCVALSYPACSLHVLYCHLGWLYHIFPRYRINYTHKKKFWTWTVCFDFLYKFCLKHFLF